MGSSGCALAEPVQALGLLERSIGYARTSLLLVTPATLDYPTPCSDWKLLDLLRHMDDSLRALQEAASLGYVDLHPREHGEGPHQLIDGLRRRACDLLGAWTHNGGAGLVSVAGCPLAASVLAATGALEIAVHGWDVAQACGQPKPLPARLAEELLDVVPQLVTEADRPTRFARPVEVARDGPLDVQLLAVLGRRPRALP